MSELKYKILCVEDDEDACELMTFVFKQAGCETETCSKTDCLKLIHKDDFSAIVLDNYFHGLTGVEICREIRSAHQKTPVIFFSGEARKEEIELAFQAGANAYLIKPNDFEILVSTTLDLIEKTKS